MCIYESQYPVDLQLFCFIVSQIDNIKQVSGKSIYSLLGRHIDRVAPFLVSRYYTQPGLLGETCRLMGMSVATFISMTRQQTYPQLFGSCDAKVLQSIARVLEVPVSALYLQESPQILAYVFQLQGPGQTRKAIEFIERMVAADLPGSVTVTIQDLLKSSQVQTLAEIIIELGHAHKAHAVRPLLCYRLFAR